MDLVTQADLAAQEAIRDVLLGAFPDHDFVGEEDWDDPRADTRKTGRSEYCWIVDPLDGTANYVHQFPNYAVSIGLRRRDEVIVGTVLDPVSRHRRNDLAVAATRELDVRLTVHP